MQQRNRPSNPYIMGMVAAVFFTGEVMAQENTDWKSRFYAEAPKRWEDYLRFTHSLQVVIRVADQNKDGNRSPEDSAYAEYKQTKGASLLLYEPGPKGEAIAVGANPSYVFKLKRRSRDKGWIITDLVVSDQSTVFIDQQKRIQETHLQDVCDCLMLEYSLWLPMLIHDPDFRITAIEPKEIDGRPVVRFGFDYPKPEKGYARRGAFRVRGGWMVLDPEHDWILREYLVHKGQPEKHFIHKTFQIREGSNRHPIITRITNQTTVKGEKLFESIVEVPRRTVERSDVPLEEFTLSAFGLPEPPGIQVERSRLYLWIALGGIACLGIAALIRWLSQSAGVAG